MTVYLAADLEQHPDGAGAPVVGITLPGGVEVEVVRSNTLRGVEGKSLGVPHVVRYSVTR